MTGGDTGLRKRIARRDANPLFYQRAPRCVQSMNHHAANELPPSRSYLESQKDFRVAIRRRLGATGIVRHRRQPRWQAAHQRLLGQLRPPLGRFDRTRVAPLQRPGEQRQRRRLQPRRQGRVQPAAGHRSDADGVVAPQRRALVDARAVGRVARAGGPQHDHAAHAAQVRVVERGDEFDGLGGERDDRALGGGDAPEAPNAPNARPMASQP